MSKGHRDTLVTLNAIYIQADQEMKCLCVSVSICTLLFLYAQLSAVRRANKSSTNVPFSSV